MATAMALGEGIIVRLKEDGARALNGEPYRRGSPFFAFPDDEFIEGETFAGWEDVITVQRVAAGVTFGRFSMSPARVEARPQGYMGDRTSDW